MAAFHCDMKARRDYVDLALSPLEGAPTERLLF